MKKMYRIITIILLSFTLFSCQKNQDIFGEVSQPIDGDWTSLEQHSYIAKFSVESNSDWEIQTEGDWFVPYQTKGAGTAIVDIEITDNNSDVRREGVLTIKFLQDQSKNKVINLRQKSLADIDDNADIQEGTRRYGVGFGYDATGNYAASSSCKSQVFLVQKMINDEIIVMDGSAQEAQKRTYTGNSVYDISQKLSVNAGLDAKYGGFKGEVKASFDQQYLENQFCEYGIYSVNVKAGYRNIEYGLNDLKDDYMAPIAKNAIDGLSDNYKGAAGIERLIANFGTHVIKRAYMGGRLDYSMSADVSKISGDYEIYAFLSAGYEGSFVSGNGSVDEKYKKSYTNNKNNCYIKVRTSGGSVSAADILNQGEPGVIAWTTSLSNAKNQTMVDFDDESLVPIWELCSDKARAAQVKQYVESYVQGVNISSAPATKIDIPQFYANTDKSLVKTAALSDGTPIAEICNEYIPILSATQRVTVVYPIVSGVVNYKYGFFVGSATQSPGRIAWNGTVCQYSKNQDLPLGALNTIYMRGLGVSTTPTEKAQNTTITDQFFTTFKNANKELISHPLVKVNSTIWMRNYAASIENYSGWPYESADLWKDFPRWRRIYAFNKTFYVYNRKGAEAFTVPNKWILPNDNICNTLKSYVNQDISKCMVSGVTGLEMEYAGYTAMQNENWAHTGVGTFTSIWGGDNEGQCFELSTGRMDVLTLWIYPQKPTASYGFMVRMVRDQNYRYY